MPLFTIRYDLTERTVQEIDVEADSLEEAKRLVGEYEFDNSDQREITSYEWSLDNVRTKEDDDALALKWRERGSGTWHPGDET